MAIYYGKSKDGSDMKEFKGFHVSENGEYWGSMPINNDGTLKYEKKQKSKYHK